MDKIFCCEYMKYHVQNHCDVHSNPFDCPDCLIYYGKYQGKENGGFGIIVHNGGEGFVEINYCPWCGEKLNADTEPSL